MGRTVRGSNPGGSEIFRTCPDRPWGPHSLLYNGYRVFPGCKERPGRDADPSPLLLPWSRKSRAVPLLPLWAVRPVQSLSACTRVHFTFNHTVGAESVFQFAIQRYSIKKVNVYLPSLMMKVPNHLYVLGDTYTCHTYCCYALHFMRIGFTLFTCDMYMCRLRHINDSVLSTLRMEAIRLLLFIVFCLLLLSNGINVGIGHTCNTMRV
jgi:hypothetical protein